jgi:hypothetical protein
VPFIDAQIDFDLRTAIPSSGPPKPQTRWLSAAYSSFANKQGANYQIQIGVLSRYERCPELRRTDAIDLVAMAWIACKPLIDAARESALQIATYGPSDQFAWHVDLGGGLLRRRKMTFVVQLSSDREYTGGDLEFLVSAEAVACPDGEARV